MTKINLLGISVTTGKYSEFLQTIMDESNKGMSRYACVANTHMIMEAHNDLKFASIVSNANVIMPDGKPLAWALKLLYGIKQERVAGMDLLPDMLKQAEQTGISVFFYGGSESMLEKTKSYLALNYPQLEIAGLYSPPFRHLSAGEVNASIDTINQSGAGLLFVVLGCPKQEKWMASMKGRIYTTMIGIGGALPVLIGMQKRAPKWMQQTGLEWTYRLVQEPGRLFRRYAVNNTMFIVLFLKTYLNQKLFNNPARINKTITTTDTI